MYLLSFKIPEATQYLNVTSDRRVVNSVADPEQQCDASVHVSCALIVV